MGLERALDSSPRRGLETIVVGVPNSGAERLRETARSPMPATAAAAATPTWRSSSGRQAAHRSARATRPEREATGIFGSSMGGLISLYAFFRAPETFGFVGAMSPSLWFGDRAIIDYIERDGTPPGRLYVDAGTEEGGGTLRDAGSSCRCWNGRATCLASRCCSPRSKGADTKRHTGPSAWCRRSNSC